jgi:hypothetical protein
MEYHDSTSTEVREHVVHAVALYAQAHAVRRLREPVPGRYAVRYRHDTDGHADERVFLAAIAAHPAIAHVRCTTPAEDEVLGVDALVIVHGEQLAVPIDVTTRGRGVPGGVANLLATLQRGVVPVVMEFVPTNIDPAVAYATFAFWRGKAEAFFLARTCQKPCITADARQRAADITTEQPLPHTNAGPASGTSPTVSTRRRSHAIRPMCHAPRGLRERPA